MSALTAAKHSQLMAYAEDRTTAGRLLRAMDRQPKMARVLWDIYCVALLTVSEPLMVEVA